MQNEDRDFEIEKLKLEQKYSTLLEHSKKEIHAKYEQHLEDIEIEKTRKLMQIEKSLKELNLTNDKPELARKLEKALSDQKDLEAKISKINSSIENQKFEARELTYQINELNKQIMEQENTHKNSKSTKVKILQEQIEKVETDIEQAEREYKKLLDETKNIGDENDLDNENTEHIVINEGAQKKFDKSLHRANNISLEKLANDISEIKSLIEVSGMNKSKMKDYLLEVEEHRKRVQDKSSTLLPFNFFLIVNKSFIQDSIYLQKDALRQEKQKIKSEQRDIEQTKKQWRQDKDYLEYHPEFATDEKYETLRKTKQNIEDRIDTLNEKISEFKQKEKQIRKQEFDQTTDDNMFDRDESATDLLSYMK